MKIRILLYLSSRYSKTWNQSDCHYQALTDSPWSYGSDVSVPGFSTYSNKLQNLTVIYANATLFKFMNYMNKRAFPFTYDLAVSFVEWRSSFQQFFCLNSNIIKILSTWSKDIWNDPLPGITIEQQSGIVGLAYYATVCGSARYSIVEEHGGFRSVHVRPFISENFHTYTTKFHDFTISLFYCNSIGEIVRETVNWCFTVETQQWNLDFNREIKLFNYILKIALIFVLFHDFTIS